MTDLGPTELKNIAEPIRVYSLQVGVPAQPKPVPQSEPKALPARPRSALRWPAIAAVLVVAIVAAGAYSWYVGLAPRFRGASVAESRLVNAPRMSIVVLPFENLTGDPGQDYFADGITDDLTTDLSHVPDSFVIARNTALTYKGRGVDPKEVGRQLGVRYALEGSVHRDGKTAEVNAQLISTENGAHIWADRFDGEPGKLGELQAEIVPRLANSLGAELVKAEASRAEHERPNNPDAVDLAMQGWASIYGGHNRANLDAAVGYFERALRLNPELTWAKIGLAEVLVDRFHVFGEGNEAVDFPHADALLTSALSAEPNNAWAHLAKAKRQFFDFRFDEAFSELDAAIENDQNFAEAYALRGVVRVFVGQARAAIPEVETAFRLDPRSSSRNLWQFYICRAYAHLGQWEKAVEWCTKSIATDATYFAPYVHLVAAYGWLNRDREAKSAIADLLKLMPGFTVTSSNKLWISYDPTFGWEHRRIMEGLRKAGLPEE